MRFQANSCSACHGGGKDDIRIIDWGVCWDAGSHVGGDVFFCHSMYSKDEIDRVNDIYFDGHAMIENETKDVCIYLNL